MTTAAVPATAADAPLIDVRSVSRTFGAVRALRDVTVQFRRGEVHGLVGANGAGKSTLLNILAGAVTPTEGVIEVEGVPTTIARPRDADALGLAFIPQEQALVPDFSAVDNMTLGLRRTARFGFGNRRERARIARAIADRLGMTFSLRRPVRLLSPAERGLVAIGRALARDARFIAMDEPTAALSDVECQRLFRIVKDLARDGVAVAYVSHRLNEIEELSDRVTVFKDGQVTGRFERGSYDHGDLIRGITGQERGTEAGVDPTTVPADATVLFRAEHLSDGQRIRDVSFDVRKGEILGLAGVVGAGRTETLAMVFGDRRVASGTMELADHRYRPNNVRRAIRHGVGLVPEERRSQALAMEESIRSNITLGNWRAMRPLAFIGFVSDRLAEAVATKMQQVLGIKARDTGTTVRKLSGGNQQKVVFARWLARNSRLLLLDEPTRGVDVGARQQIWQTVEEFTAAGNAAVVVSSELDELSICHRVVVLVEGRTVAELTGPGVTEEQMLSVIYEHNSENTRLQEDLR